MVMKVENCPKGYGSITFSEEDRCPITNKTTPCTECKAPEKEKPKLPPGVIINRDKR